MCLPLITVFLSLSLPLRIHFLLPSSPFLSVTPVPTHFVADTLAATFDKILVEVVLVFPRLVL